MKRLLLGTMRWIALVTAGGALFAANGCLPDTYWSQLLGSTITSTVGAVVGAVALKFVHV